MIFRRCTLYCALCMLILISLGDGERTKDKMYESISGGTACVRRMNGTHQIGCTSSRKGSVGVVHFVESESDLNFILENGSSPPYIPTIPTWLFTSETAKKLVGSDKINGLVVYRQNDTKPSSFTHEKTCPNELSNLKNTCSKDWNPYGTGLGYFDFPFPIFYVKSDEDVAKIRNCFARFNNFSYEEHNDRSLCALQISSFMFATTDTPTCLRRSNSVLNVNPVKFCDPLGGDNVWASLFPIAEENKTTTEQKFIVLAARVDTTSLFYEVMPGASNPLTGIVALLSTAQIMKQMFKNGESYETNVLFIFFNGETYDYMGSQRLLYDMENGDFPMHSDDFVPQIRPENISLFVEFSQLSHSDSIYAHVLQNDSEIASFLTKLNKHGGVLNLRESLGIVPPSSLQTFLKHKSNISGLVLADHKEAYVNRFYNSIYDNASNIQFVYYENVTEEDYSTIPLDSLQWHIANVSEMVAKSVYEEITGKEDSNSVKGNVAFINELFECYLENPDCRIHQAIQKKKIQSFPYGFYVGVVPSGRNLITHLLGLTLAWVTGDVVDTGNHTCSEEPKSHIFRYIVMSKSIDDLNTTQCFRTTLNFTDAVSPAFLIKGYDWSSGLYSSWTESSWQDISVRMFLRPSTAHETMTMAIGSITLVFSLAFVYFIKSKSHILFAPPVVSSPANC